MREIMSCLFNHLIDPLELPLEPIWEWGILLLIGVLAFHLAFSAVGTLYRDDLIHGSTIGSILHWSIRLFFFVTIWAIVNAVIRVGKWLIAHWVVLSTVIMWVGLIYLFSRYVMKDGRKNA